jgi:hypothetical protein
MFSSTDSISTNRAIFADSIRSSTENTDQHCIFRLPLNHHTSDKAIFISKGLKNLKTAVEPIRKEFEKYLLDSPIAELLSVNLCADIVYDSFMESSALVSGTWTMWP